jgi:CheY-like chemotaxis protein
MALKFLIVDDSKAMQTIVKRILTNAGYADHDFRFSDDGEGAIREIVQWKPDMVLLDWHMPGISGLQVLRKIRELEIKTKIGLITAEKNASSIEQAKQAGAVFVIHKPFTNKDLQESLIPALAGVSTPSNKAISTKEIIFPSPTALSMFISTITGERVKVEQVKSHDVTKLLYPCKIALYGNNDKQIRAVQVLDSNLTERLSELFASSVYRGQAFDDKLLTKSFLRSLTVFGATCHDLKHNRELSLFKTYAMPKLIDKVVKLNELSGDDRLDLKFTFSDGDSGHAIFYIENTSDNA